MNKLLELNSIKSKYDNKKIDAVREYLLFCSKSHPNKGAKGAICPFLPKAIHEETVYCSIIDEDIYNENEIKDAILEGIENFKDVKTDDELDKYKTLVLIFLTNKPLDNILKKIHQDLKPMCINQGIMIGEFYPSNNKSGLYNELFYPVKCDVPMIAIRNLVKEDITFFEKEKNPTDKISYLIDYKHSLKDQLLGSEIENIDKLIIETNDLVKGN